ncbi:sucrose nonfermenting 4-like protein isoform X1 [Capsicum annuum]|uniref:sucrose nonfermenting 4-like protein isoform X1 n=1 Tax=Capsicum annuum TaxID=4072 RepID=UPI0007BEF414|nr:sucrose nonfermenting 4-like protein isoform X1 [Capsicum annuum]XP_016563036.1 sucrose nonfermenting 4-like protein isoform X1 [Capsicum annuum]
MLFCSHHFPFFFTDFVDCIFAKACVHTKSYKGNSECEVEMVLITFTWRHGGTQVFLCGSFHGWSEQIPMNLVEGLVAVFQRIVDVPPGYHKYKFLVDGIWQVDQDQLCVQDEYGEINNLVFVEESGSMPSALPREDTQSNLASGSARSMHPEASSSRGLQLEPVMQLSNNEINVSRHRLFMFLSSSQAYELIPDSGKVFALDTEVAVEQAFHIMYEKRLAVMPLWDERNAMITGMLTASDFILILLKLQESHPTLTNDELGMHTVSAWKYGKFQFHAEVSGAMVPPNRRVLQAAPDESLKDVVQTLLQNKISAVPLLHSPEDGSSPQLLHTACLAGILKHICRHFRHSLEYLPILQQPVGNLPFGTFTGEVAGRPSSRVLLTLHSRDLLSSALKLLIEGGISSIPIVDDNGALINVYSRSDITSLARDNVYARFRLDQIIMTQVLQVLDETSHDRCRTCTRFDSLYRIMELLSDPTVRRVVVIDPTSRHVEGIITLRDVCNLLLG